MKKPIVAALVAWLALAFLASHLSAATPADQNFDGTNGPGISSRIIGDWQFRLLDANGDDDNGGGDFVDIIDFSETNVTALAFGPDNALTLIGTTNVAVSAQIRSRFADPFRLVAFAIDGDDKTYVVTGYLGGLPVPGATQSFFAPIQEETLVVLITNRFWNIDEFRISRQDGVADVYIFIDDINVNNPVTTSLAPVIANLDGDSVTYLEGASPVQLDAATIATVSDPDSSDFHGGTIVASITANRIPPQDILGIQHQGTGAGQIGVSGTNVSYAGTLVATFSGGSGYTDLLIALNTNASKTAVEAIVRALTYENTSTGVPITNVRTVSIRLYDGDGGYTAVSTTVAIQLNNYPPSIFTTGNTNSFLEGINEPSVPIEIDPGLTLDDVDSTELASATVAIVRNFAEGEDLLLFTNAPSTMGNIIGSYDSTNGILSLSSAAATATLAQWTAALRSIAYLNSSETPSAASRSIRFLASDGVDVSDSATNYISVAAFNDPPVNTIPTNTLLAAFNQSIVFSATNAISIADADASTNSIQVSLTVSTGMVSLASIQGLSFIVGDGTNDDLVGFTGTVSDINAALDGLTFTPSSGYSGAAEIVLFTSDLGNSGPGGFQSDSDTIQIIVNPPPASVTSISSTNANGIYALGDIIGLTVTFDQAVTVDTSGGTPALEISVGTTNRFPVAYSSGSGTPTLLFLYTVLAGHQSVDLDYAITNALDLNGGAISNLITVAANLGLPPVGSAGSLGVNNDLAVDGILPTVAAIVRDDPNPTISSNVTFTVTFSELVSGVDLTDFTLTASGTVTGTLDSITPVTGAYQVAVTDISGEGTLRLDLNAIGTGIIDVAGQAITGGYTNGELYTIDRTDPSSPVFVGISEDTGTEGDQVTADSTLLIHGTAEANVTVTLTRLGVGVIGSTNADSSGNWTFDYTATILPDGTNTFTAIATDGAGNTSVASASFGVIIESTFSLTLLRTPTVYGQKKPAVKLDPSATVDAGGRTHLGGGQLAVSIATNGTSGDVLSVYTATNSAQGISLVGTNILWGDLLIAELTRGNAVTNPLTFAFTTNATPSAVQALVREISFLTTNSSTLARTLRLVLSDGLGSTTEPAFKTVLINKALPLAGVTNLFTNSVGTFSGLVLRTNDVVATEAGYFQVKLTPRLSYSGYVLIAGKKASFSGQFNTNGQATIITSGSKWGIDLQLSPDASGIRGRVTSYAAGGWTSDLVGYLTAIGTATNTAVASGAYTLLLPPSNDPQVGSGWATITVDRLGQAKLKGTLADGLAWTSSSAIGTNGHWPLYASLDKKRGAMIGWLSFSNTTPAVIGGTLTWLKPVSVPFFTNGIAAELDIAGSRYLAPVGTNAMLSWTNGLLSVANGNLAAPLTNAVNVTTLGKFTGSSGSISNLTLSFSTKVGSFKGSFRHPVTSKTTKYSGVLLQSENLGGGFFLGTNRGGVLQLNAAP